jgi:predicted RNase H-like HicB family nuclease
MLGQFATIHSLIPRHQPCGARISLANSRCCVKLKVEIEQEEDGRWIAEVPELPGVLAYGNSADDARAKVQALALRVLADRLEHGEAGPNLLDISFIAA